MKKLITIGLAAVMTFAVANTAQAAVAFETNAELRARAFYLKSYTGYAAANGKSNEFWDQRLRLGMTWQVSDSVKLNVRADILEGLWGDNAEVVGTTVKEDSAGVHTVTNATTGVAKKASIDFDWVNMQFTWPGTPLTFTIGRQDASWGPGLVSKSDPRDRFKVLGAFDFGTLGFVYQKRAEILAHDVGTTDDNRQYGLLYIGKAAGWSFGFLELATFYDADPVASTTSYTSDVFVTGKAGPVSLSFEGAYAFGTKDFADAATKDLDLTGMAAYLGAFVPAGPVTIGVEGIYNAGDKKGTATKNEGSVTVDYHNPFWSVVLFNNLDYNGYAGESSVSGNSSVKNAWAAKLSVVAQPVAGLTIVGAAVYASRLEDTATVKADALGTEFDLIFIYAVTPNVSWTVGAGYLLPGDYYTGNPDNALAAVSNFTLKF
jgi:hypothetical protein